MIWVKVEKTDCDVGHLPYSVLVELSRAWIEHSRFADALAAFGPLPEDGQLELVNRLVDARAVYALNRRHELDRDDRPSRHRERLAEIGAGASRLLRLQHRDGVEPQPWYLHPAIEIAFPALYRVARSRRPTKIESWKPGERLGILAEILGDLVALSDQAIRASEDDFSNTRGGKRRQGPKATAELVQALMETYAALRMRWPESGPRLAFDKALRRFLRVGLEFAVSYAPISDPNGGVLSEQWEATVIDAELAKPTRTTDAALRGIYQRWRSRIKI
jgi:hypothetical protein